MVGAPAQDTSRGKPISRRSRHGTRLQSISAPLRLLVDRLMEEVASPRNAESRSRSKICRLVWVGLGPIALRAVSTEAARPLVHWYRCINRKYNVCPAFDVIWSVNEFVALHRRPYHPPQDCGGRTCCRDHDR